MAVFSDLPNELIMIIWGYVIEPESVERFALVSKGIHGLAAPFLREHARLKQQYSGICYPDSSKHGGAAFLLERMLLNPRIALYIKELEIDEWASCWDARRNRHTSPYPTHTMDTFKDAIRHCFLVSPTEAGSWVADIEAGDEEPILALIIKQLTRLTKLGLWFLELQKPSRFLEALCQTTGSPEASISPGLSTIGSEIKGNNQVAFTRPSICSHISDLSFETCDIGLRGFSRLLRSTRELKSFAIFGSINSTIKPFHLFNELLASSRHSLQRLSLQNVVMLDEPEARSMGNITQFESLTVLNIDFVLLLGSIDKNCRRLADVVPISVEMVTLYSKEVMSSETLEEVVLQMVKSKTDRLPNLLVLTFDLYAWKVRSSELFFELTQKSMDVGVFLSMIPPFDSVCLSG